MYLEYCDGGAMDSVMAELYRPLTEPQIAYVCKYLVEALAYIHSHKVCIKYFGLYCKYLIYAAFSLSEPSFLLSNIPLSYLHWSLSQDFPMFFPWHT